eukprot:2974689-Lingulodinium_polyedra.AAC.1
MESAMAEIKQGHVKKDEGGSTATQEFPARKRKAPSAKSHQKRRAGAEEPYSNTSGDGEEARAS